MIDYEIERRKANAEKEVWKAVQKAYEEIDKATEKAIEDIASFRNHTIRCDGQYRNIGLFNSERRGRTERTTSVIYDRSYESRTTDVSTKNGRTTDARTEKS